MSETIMSVDQAIGKIATRRLIEEVFDRLDDHLYAPEPRRDNMFNSMDQVAKQNLYMMVRDIVEETK